MKIGFHLTPFWSPTDRGATRIIDEAVAVVSAASRMGFSWVSIGQHFVSHPTVWPQPFPILARLAPETGSMRLKTSVLLLPMLNAVEVAENIATLDHICHGRLDVGVAIGYREAELEMVGLARVDRVKKLEESLELMKRLWAGEVVTFHGAYTSVTNGRMGFPPYQAPHPPLEMGAQSEGATRRAARLTDGVFFGPQVAWRDIAGLARVFRDARAASGAATPGYVGASRSLIVGASKEAARAAAREYLERTFTMYRTWQMQESTMVELQLSSDVPLDDWTVNGSPEDCVEAIARAREMGLERIGFTIYSLPREVEARIDYMQMIAERVLGPAGALA
jgi:alkanesulfonate monooxygenase SsuD/methylene tetrahydromethanopterin reductase-like flavin-dependent oxidoreductase (luciferase family)